MKLVSRIVEVILIFPILSLWMAVNGAWYGSFLEQLGDFIIVTVITYSPHWFYFFAITLGKVDNQFVRIFPLVLINIVLFFFAHISGTDAQGGLIFILYIPVQAFVVAVGFLLGCIVVKALQKRKLRKMKRELEGAA